MRIAMYRGVGTISGMIQWFTRSVYSHCALWYPERGECYEAVARGFVEAGSLVENHTRGIVVDMLEYKIPLTKREESDILHAAKSMVGAPYDYEAVFGGFPLRLGFEPKGSAKKFFCSEAVFMACAAASNGRVLLERIQPWKVSPDHISISPLLKWTESIVL